MGREAHSAEGVHGQFIYVNPGAGVVIAKASTWKTSWPEDRSGPAIAGMHAIADFLSDASGMSTTGQ